MTKASGRCADKKSNAGSNIRLRARKWRAGVSLGRISSTSRWIGVFMSGLYHSERNSVLILYRLWYTFPWVCSLFYGGKPIDNFHPNDCGFIYDRFLLSL